MPPVLRNELAHSSSDDPKVILDGLAVSGLLGILRQLGDLAELAADVFHGVQEQVMRTSCRSQRLMGRLHHMEHSLLPPLEKLLLAQTSHIHFAYTPGAQWHPHLPIQTNHFVSYDLPPSLMDSYDASPAPPRLHLLDKFDIGGPGSCLKRYSDPTFFKRAAAISDEAGADKLQTSSKARRIKKKRSSKQTGGDVLRGPSMSTSRNHSVIPPIVDGQSSPSHSTSTVDPGITFDLGDNQNSFNSRIESGYIECVFHQSSSLQAEENESKDSPFNMIQHNDASDSASLDEHARFVDDSLLRSSVQEQMTSTSSCVTWDEKAELLESKEQEKSVVETLYTFRDQSQTEVGAPVSGDVNSPMDHLMEMLGDESINESVSSQNRIDEVDSEPDNYVDALNTIESESENDLDYQTKRELKRFSSIPDNEGRDGMYDLALPRSDYHPPTLELHPDSLVSLEKEVLSDLPISVASESCGREEILASACPLDEQLGSGRTNSCSLESRGFDQVSQMATESSAAISRSSDVLDGPELEAPIPDTTSSEAGPAATQHWLVDNAVSNVSESGESPTDLSSKTSVKIWTNGGLLGLMPSKPRDFTMASPVIGDSINSSQANNTPSTSANGTGSSRENDIDEDSKLSSGMVPPVALNIKYRLTETSLDKDKNSSLVFGLSRKLLSNGFGKNVSDMDDSGKFEVTSSSNGKVLEQRRETPNRSVPETEFREQFGYRSALSLTASPPLEHMKISFHPLDGLEASKLKLKFSGGGMQSQERIRDMFPSFQLIPDTSIPPRDYGSDSDDDTFCRSSPFMSDDCRSHNSDSNSEQWEYGETTEGKGNEICDALCGISSLELVPSSFELDGMPKGGGICFDGDVIKRAGNSGIDVESSISNPFLDLPTTNDHNPSNNLPDSGYLEESSSMPPPLPPIQWRALKPQIDVVENVPDVASESFKHVLDLNVSGSATSQQHINVEPSIQSKIKEHERKWNTQKELNHPPNGKSTLDEKEDFLQQIRTKSFNLRRTVMEKATMTASGPPANVNVTAILQKANAIRQAVGSDDGEDDTWSDT